MFQSRQELTTGLARAADRGFIAAEARHRHGHLDRSSFVDQLVAVPANRLQVLDPVRPAVGTELPVVNLQPLEAPAPGTPPVVLPGHCLGARRIHDLKDPATRSNCLEAAHEP